MSDTDTIGFTPDEIAEGEQYRSLGPEYFGARKAAEAFMAKFEAEHFKSLIDDFADKFRDKLWDDVTDYFLSDTESNLHSALARMVEGTINALLTGEGWAMERYPLAKYHDGEAIRKRIAEHSGDTIAKARIADLEKEVASLKSSLEWARR